MYMYIYTHINTYIYDTNNPSNCNRVVAAFILNRCTADMSERTDDTKPRRIANPASPKTLASDYLVEENFVLENWEFLL